jgi:riboflavin synthase alpha subunit
VRGVIEATGKLDSLTPEGDAVLARYSAPPDILRHMIVKGPITIDGASLTVIAKDAETFTVSLVQYTQEHTSHVTKKPGDTMFRRQISSRATWTAFQSANRPTTSQRKGGAIVSLFACD